MLFFVVMVVVVVVVVVVVAGVVLSLRGVAVMNLVSVFCERAGGVV